MPDALAPASVFVAGPVTFPIPAMPKPLRVQDVAYSRPALDVEIDRAARHARARATHRVRRRRLIYQAIRDEVDTFLQFYKDRKGRAERFAFADPVDAVTYQARFSRQGMSWRQVGNGLDYLLEFQIEEAP